MVDQLDGNHDKYFNSDIHIIMLQLRYRNSFNILNASKNATFRV